nr:hypothetical protein [Tanacetum cinerariifolium]
MTTPNVTSSTDGQMHNNIMAAGSRDRSPMLATGRYPQWRSRFLRYIDTRPNNEALKKCILSGPYKPTAVLVQPVEATDDSLAVPEHTKVETPMNMSPENKAHFEAEKEAIHLILTGIRDEIYSTDVKTNLFWEFGKFTSHDGETMESYYTRFYKLMNEMIRNNLTVIKMQVNVQFLQQLQPEWSRLARNANPLALVATTLANQDPYYQTSRSHKSHAPSSKPSILTRSHTTTRYKGKEIAKLITPPSEIASEEDNDPKQAQRDKDMQKNLALIAKEFGHFAKECRKPKRVKDSVYHKEKMLLCKQAEQGVPLHAEQYDWLADTNEEVDEQELKAHYSYMEKIQEVPTADSCTDSEPVEHVQNDAGYNVFTNDLQHSVQSESVSNTCLVETDDRNVIPDSPDMCEDDIQNDQNDVESDDERVVLAKLIANLKLDTSKSLGESISVRDSCLVALQTKHAEFEKYKAFNDRTIDHDKLKRRLNETLEIIENAWIKHSKDQFRAPTAQDMEILIQSCLMPLATKTQNDSFRYFHELKQEMHADLKYVKSLEKEIDKLESDKAEFSDMYDVILQECVSNDVKCSYLMSLSDLDALDELQCLYLHKMKEYDCLAQKLSKQTESVSKKVHNKLLQRFAKVEKHSISLEIALQKCKEQLKNDTVCNEKALNVSRKEREQYFKIQDLKAQPQDKNITISELKKLIEKGKGKSMDTKFDKPSFVRQPNAQRIPKPSVLGKPAPFLNSLDRIYFPKTMSVPKANVSEGLSKPVTAHNLPQTAKQAVSNTNVLKPGTYRIDNKSTLTRAPQLPQTIVQLILFIVDSGCTKHMTGNLKLLCNFVEKFLGTVRFSNDQFTPILGYRDLVQGNVTINMVYYVEGLNHNLFSGNDLLIGNRRSDLYTISLHESTSSTPLCLMAKATPTQAWLWHRRLSHLNFDYINMLSKKDIVIGLPKLKYVKDQLSSSCELSKANRSSFKSKAVPSLKGRLNLLHMDLCGPMHVASINGKKYILVIVNDYSRYTWTLFLRSKDETPESKGYRIYNKRTRMIVESIHSRFDEFKEVSETSVANNTSGLIPQRQKASNYDNPDPVPQRQDVSSSADAHVASQQELDLLFGPLYDEFFNAGSNPQDKQPSINIQSTSAPSTHTYVHAEENNDQVEEGEHLQDDEFTNPFCALAQEEAGSCSHNIEQVHGNPSRPVQTRRQLATDPEMCMFALTVSIAEPKNIKEAMADSAWIEAMQEELYQFDRLQVWELVDKPFGKSVIKLKWLWKNKKDEDQTVIRNKARLVAKGYAQEEGIDFEESFTPVARL